MKKGIPTKYRGRQYRSRLEARWAAMFDMLGWKYEYEPFDLNGWIPDFVINGIDYFSLVEVKPITFYDSNVYKKYRLIMDSDNYSKIHLILLGSVIPLCKHDIFPVIGWMQNKFVPSNFEELSHEENCGHAQIHLPKLGIMSLYHCSTNNSHNHDLVNHNGLPEHELEPMTFNKLQYMWQESGNIVQWKPNR